MPRLASARVSAQLQRRSVSGFYGDTANYHARTSASTDSFGQPVISITTTAIACSFTDRPALENWRNYADIGVVDAEIRFVSPAPAKGDQITLTAHFGSTAYVDKTFDIVGIRDRGPFGYVCALRAVVL